MNGKISLAGDLGSGKSTVSKILIDRLGAEYYSTGSIVRQVAERMNMSVVELNEYMETHPEIDTEIDNGLRALSLDTRLLVIDSRMAWHFTEGTFKVYMSTDIETGAIRIMGAKRQREQALTVEKAIEDTRRRRLSEQKRYKDSYGVDINDLSNYDLIVDTTYATPDEIAEVIISAFTEWQRGEGKKYCYLSSERINCSNEPADEKKVLEYSRLIEAGEEIPEISVFEKNGEFYLSGEPELLLARAFEMSTFVCCRLVSGTLDGREYVKMKNSL